MIRNAFYFATQLWYNISRNYLMSAAAISTSAIALLTLGIFLIMVFNINSLTEELSAQMEIRAFLKKDATDVKSLIDELEKIPQVRSVEFLSPEEALKKLEKNLNIDLDMPADENPLPAALVIRVNDARQIETVAAQASRLKGIQDIMYGESILRKIRTLSMTIKFLGFFVTILMGVGTLLTLINTIRLTVIARKAEIRTMQLVGATSWFIRWPFLLEGVFIGLIGAIFSSMILSLGYLLFYARMQAALNFIFPLVGRMQMAQWLVFLLSLCGIFMGIAGSYISVTRFLEEEV